MREQLQGNIYSSASNIPLGFCLFPSVVNASYVTGYKFVRHLGCMYVKGCLLLIAVVDGHGSGVLHIQHAGPAEAYKIRSGHLRRGAEGRGSVLSARSFRVCNAVRT